MKVRKTITRVRVFEDGELIRDETTTEVSKTREDAEDEPKPFGFVVLSEGFE